MHPQDTEPYSIESKTDLESKGENRNELESNSRKLKSRVQFSKEHRRLLRTLFARVIDQNSSLNAYAHSSKLITLYDKLEILNAVAISLASKLSQQQHSSLISKKIQLDWAKEFYNGHIAAKEESVYEMWKSIKRPSALAAEKFVALCASFRNSASNQPQAVNEPLELPVLQQLLSLSPAQPIAQPIAQPTAQPIAQSIFDPIVIQYEPTFTSLAQMLSSAPLFGLLEIPSSSPATSPDRKSVV